MTEKPVADSVQAAAPLEPLASDVKTGVTDPFSLFHQGNLELTKKEAVTEWLMMTT